MVSSSGNVLSVLITVKFSSGGIGGVCLTDASGGDVLLCKLGRRKGVGIDDGAPGIRFGIWGS